MPSIETDSPRYLLKYSSAASIFAVSVWLKRYVCNVWQGIREWCGDSAYERYLQAKRTVSNESSILTPAEFYVEQLNRRYSRPNRCC